MSICTAQDQDYIFVANYLNTEQKTANLDTGLQNGCLFHNRDNCDSQQSDK